MIPHRGEEWLFWMREGWQTLCSPDHSTKTAYERRIPIGMMYPRDLPGTDREVVLLCGPDIGYTPPTTGAVIDENLGLHYRDAVASGIRLEDPVAHLEWRNAALQEELEKDRHAGPLWFVTPAPRTAERAYWSTVLHADPKLFKPAIELLPVWWWEQYNRDQKAEEAMRRRGWPG